MYVYIRIYIYIYIYTLAGTNPWDEWGGIATCHELEILIIFTQCVSRFDHKRVNYKTFLGYAYRPLSK